MSDLSTKEKDIILALTDHESWHAKFTDFKHLIINSKHAKNEKYLSSSINLISNGLEDGRITYLGVLESEIIKKGK